MAEEALRLPGLAAPLALRWTLPAGGPIALVLHLHAGAFTAGSPAEGERMARLLAAEGARVASLAYPLSPAQPFPQPLEAVHAALEWLHRQRRKLKAERLPLLVAGEEAGGNLAAAAALAARDRCAPPLHGQVLLSPMLDACTATASLRDAHAGEPGCRWAEGWRRYLARACDALHPYATPGRAMRLSGLAPALLVTAADDPLRDETRAYAGRLRQAGVPVDEVLLTAPTGWPQSHRAPGEAPWSAELGPPLRAFLQSRRAAVDDVAGCRPRPDPRPD
jgi:acetyl esterase/lipase